MAEEEKVWQYATEYGHCDALFHTKVTLCCIRSEERQIRLQKMQRKDCQSGSNPSLPFVSHGLSGEKYCTVLWMASYQNR